MNDGERTECTGDGGMVEYDEFTTRETVTRHVRRDQRRSEAVDGSPRTDTERNGKRTEHSDDRGVGERMVEYGESTNGAAPTTFGRREP